MTDLTFEQSVQNLPQEVFDYIYDLVFGVTATDGDTAQCRYFQTKTYDLEITPSYKPPVQLQIDRASRTAFQAKYYSDRTFAFFNSEAFRVRTHGLAYRWIRSLEPSIRARLTWLRTTACGQLCTVGDKESEKRQLNFARDRYHILDTSAEMKTTQNLEYFVKMSDLVPWIPGVGFPRDTTKLD